jgi:GNAT superfamily N-acetyltransferase
VRIERFDPVADGTRLAACYELWQAVQRHDDPDGAPISLISFTGWWATGFSGEPRQVWLATDDSGPVGCYLLELPHRENTGLGVTVLIVAPGARRRGLGTELLAHCCTQAGQAGRSRVTTELLEGSPGDAFARAVGGRAGLTEVRRILSVDETLPARLARLRAEAEPSAAGYEMLTWAGRTPSEYLDQVVLVNEAMNDAPREADIEPERWDTDRVRVAEERTIEHGGRLYSAAARHVATGEFAALSQLMTDSLMPGWGYQFLTAVTRAHRGHRLGLLVKVATHQWLVDAEPGVRRVVTSNSETNRHMIAINEALGYRPDARLRSCELSIPDYLSRHPASHVTQLSR